MPTQAEKQIIENLRGAIRSLNAALHDAAQANIEIKVDYYTVEPIGQRYPSRIYSATVTKPEFEVTV